MISFLCVAVDAVNRDVFEPLFKRPSKSSRSSKSSSESIRMGDDSIETTPTQTHHQFDSSTYRKSKSKPSILTKFTDEKSTSKTAGGGGSGSDLFQPNSSTRSEKSKPRTYLFGATFGRSSANKIDSEKENFRTNNNGGKDDDRFKTVTVNSLRRSFRDSFLESSKPAKGREHQPIWFIDVKDEINKKNSEPKRSIGRHDTFRVEKDSASSPSHPLSRHETFRINGREYIPSSAGNSLEHKRSPSVDSNHSARRSLGPIRVDILNTSIGSDRSGKMVPVGVAAPYSALNDIADQSNKYPAPRPYEYRSPRTESRTESRTSSRNRTQNTSYDSYEEDSHRPNSTSYAPTKSNYSSSPEEHPYRPNERRSATYSPSRKLAMDFLLDRPSRDSPDAIKMNTTNRPLPENKFISARQSFRDLNLGPERSTASRPTYRIGSFRSVHETKPKFFGDDEPDTGDRPYSSKEPNALDRKDWTHQSWRNISSRPFNRDIDNNNDEEPENRSFVPYYKYNSDRQTDPSNAKNQNNNRTTININYNYNLSPTKPINRTPTPTNAKLTSDYNNETILKRHIEPIEVPLPTLKAAKQKEKSSKNRSVNFPSVEYEVRLISPNYDTKPRRKDSWKSKPSNDWTFNKVHL